MVNRCPKKTHAPPAICHLPAPGAHSKKLYRVLVSFSYVRALVVNWPFLQMIGEAKCRPSVARAAATSPPSSSNKTHTGTAVQHQECRIIIRHPKLTSLLTNRPYGPRPQEAHAPPCRLPPWPTTQAGAHSNEKGALDFRLVFEAEVGGAFL